MALGRLQIEGFRCLTEVRIDLDHRYNLFLGPNGSGKTSLLEAVYFLGRGRGPHGRRLEPMIQDGRREFQIVGHINEDAGTTVIGVRGGPEGSELRIGGRPAESAADLARHFAPQALDPDVHRLLEDGPQRRRRYLDWGVFHVEPQFLPIWQRYYRSLKQRNRLLRTGAPAAEIEAWEPELAEAGEQLARLRAEYLRALRPSLARIGGELLGQKVDVSYAAGWPAALSLKEALRASEERDLRLRATHAGPHRADITLKAGGAPARHRVSRGQQKLLAAALILAQLERMVADDPARVALLLDDPGAELDQDSVRRLASLVRDLPVQLLVTALRDDLPGLGPPGRVFHVERGEIRPA